MQLDMFLTIYSELFFVGNYIYGDSNSPSTWKLHATWNVHHYLVTIQTMYTVYTYMYTYIDI